MDILFHFRTGNVSFIEGGYFNGMSPPVMLKGHDNEADFLGLLQKLVPHRSLKLHFEPFQFLLQIRGDIRNRKTTPRLDKSESRLLNV
jgi:hypothetical protein